MYSRNSTFENLNLPSPSPPFPSPLFTQTWLDNVECNGTENTIFACLHSNWGDTNCDSNHKASAICTSEVAWVWWEWGEGEGGGQSKDFRVRTLTVCPHTLAPSPSHAHPPHLLTPSPPHLSLRHPSQSLPCPLDGWQ